MQAIQSSFMEHVSIYGLSYGTVEEYNFRMNIFAEKNQMIESHNASDSSFTLGLNKFSTWTDAEYMKLMGYKATNIPREHIEDRTYTYATSVDWITAGAVTPVKDQG